MKLWNDQDSIWVDSLLEPDFSAVLKIVRHQAKAIGTPDGLYGKYSILPTLESDCLMEDAANRYEKAFGGVAGFQNVLKKNKTTAENLPDAFVAALKNKGILLPPVPPK